MNIQESNSKLNDLSSKFIKDIKDFCEEERHIHYDGYPFMLKSVLIDLSDDKVSLDDQITKALESLKFAIRAIESLNLFKIFPNSIHWMNVRDSDFNIFGDKGFFILRYQVNFIEKNK
jgi:hypothetical protein